MGTTSGVRRTLWQVIAVAMVAAVLVALPAPPALAAPPTFSKTFAPNTIGPGSVTTLTFTITNGTEVVPALDLAFTDNLPTAITIATPANAGSTCEGELSAPNGGATISLSGGTVGAGASCTITVDVTASSPGTHTNTTGDLTSTAGNAGTATHDLVVATDRPGFSKSFSPGTVELGYRSRLTFTIDNSANAATARNVTFTDMLPTGLVVADPADVAVTCPPALGGSGAVTAIAGSNTISIPSPGFEVGAGAACTIAVDVVAGAVGELVNSSGDLNSLNGSFGIVSSGKANAALTVTRAPLHLVKEFIDDPVAPGGQATLALEITNFSRDETATGIAFSDDLDAALAGMVALSPLPANPCGAGSALAGTDTLTLTGGTLPAEGSCSFSVTVVVPAGAAAGRYTNTTGPLSGTVGGSPVAGNVASDDLFVATAPVLTKEYTDDPVGAGGTVNLRFTITDTSTTGSTDIAFVDDLPTDLPLTVASLPTVGFCGPGSRMFISRLGAPTFGDALSMDRGSLAAGASCTFDVGFAISNGLEAGTYSHTNTTGAITATADGVSVVGNSASDDLTVVGAPSLDKQFSDGPFRPGETVTLEFTLSNGTIADDGSDGVQAASEISFTDDLAFVSGLTATGLPVTDICGVGSSLSASAGDTLLSFTGGSLDPLASCTFAVTLQSSVSTPQGARTNSTSELEATVAGVPVIGPAATDTLTVTGLTLAKEFTDDPAIPGGSVTLEFTIDNPVGAPTATAISFTDDLGFLSGLTATGLPAADVCGAGSSLIATSGDTVISFGDGSLAGGDSCTFAVTLAVPAGAEPNIYRNVTSSFRATISGSPTFPPNATDLLEVVEPDVTLTKEFADVTAIPGGTVTVDFSLENPSPVTIEDVEFTDDLLTHMPGFTAIAVTTTPTSCGGAAMTIAAGGGLLAFGPAVMSPGDVCSFTATLQVAPDVVPGTYTNTTTGPFGTFGGSPITGTPASDDLIVDGASGESADLSITKTDDHDPAVVGDTLVYTLTVSNAGPDDAPSAVVTDTLPAGVTFVSTTGCAEDPGGVPHCTVGPIAAGSSVSYTVTVTIDTDAVGPITNSASVSSRTPDPNSANNSVTEETAVEGPPTADAGGPYPPVLEGGSVALDGTASTDPDQSTATLTFEWDFDGDGAYDDATGPNPTYNAIDGPATVIIGLKVTDSLGSSDTDTATVTIENVQPTMGLSTLSNAVEGALHTVNIQSINDPGDDTVQEFQVDWGDGSSDTWPGNSTFFTHVYADDTPFGPNEPFIKVGLTDEDGTYAIAGAIFLTAVLNVAPTIESISVSAASVDEGDSVSVSGSFTDPALGVATETFTGTALWSDGVITAVVVDSNAGTFITSRTFDDDGPSPGNGTAADPYTVEITITDDDGGTNSATSPVVTVNNVAPTISELVVSPSVDENGLATLQGEFIDPGTSDVHTVDIDWGDGTTDTLTLPPGDRDFTTTHQFLDDGPSPGNGTPADPYTVDVTISDDDGGTNTASTQTQVTNVAPSWTTASLNTLIDENGQVSLEFNFDDPGTLDVHTVDIDWGDGSTDTITLPLGDRSVTTTHRYLDDGPSPGNGTPQDTATIAIDVTDDDGGLDGVSLGPVVDVKNVAPILTSLVASPSVDENGQATLQGSFTDPGTLDVHTVDIDWGDGTTDTLTLPLGDRDFTTTHQYLDDGPSPGNGTPADLATITVTVDDDDTGTDTASTQTQVKNVVPTISFLAVNASVDENGLATLQGGFIDPGTLDVHTVDIDWGDGTTDTLTLPLGDRDFTTTHQYLDDGPSPGNGTPADPATITVTVTDDDTGAGFAHIRPEIRNVAPTITGLTVAPSSTNEQGTVELTVDFADPGTLDEHLVTIDWGDGTPSTLIDLTGGERSTIATHQYDDDNPTGTPSDEFTVTVTVSDDDTGSHTATAPTVTVNNVAPTITSIAVSPGSLDEGDTVDVTGTFTDPALGVGTETFTATALWSDGETTAVIVDGTAGTFATSRTFDDDHPATGTPSDNFTVTVTVTDDDTGSHTATSPTVTVNNVAPTITSITVTPASLDEGDTVDVTGTFTDPALGVGTETFTATALWSDGETTAVIVDGTAGTFATSRTFDDDHPATGTPSDNFTVTVTVTDDDTGSHTATSPTVTVNNVAPTITSITVTPASLDEGDTVDVTGTFTDPALGVGTETFTATALWSDGETTPVIVDGTAGTFATSRTFDDDHPATGTPSDNFTVTVTVTDDDTGSHTATSPTVTVNNVAPTITSLAGSASCLGATGEGETVSVSGLFTDAGIGDTHVALVDWGDGSTSLAAVTGSGDSGGFASDHTYVGGGIYTITVTLTDDDTGSATATTTVVVAGVALIGGELHVVGTSDKDRVDIKYKSGDDLIEVKADFISPNKRTFPASDVLGIRVVLCGGDDRAKVHKGVLAPVVMDGGDGTDKLVAGHGPSVLLGGPGKDKLFGGKHRDILIGGPDRDGLKGGDDDDILIGGTSTFDTDKGALLSILAQWTSGDDFETRTSALAGVLVPNATVFDDGARDSLKGQKDRDWFFADVDGLGGDDDLDLDDDEDLLTPF